MTSDQPNSETMIVGFYRGRRVEIVDTYNMPDGERAHVRFLDTGADETAVVAAHKVSNVKVVPR